MASFPLKKWLQTGWVLELRAVPGGVGSRFWLGWGETPKLLNSKDKSDFEAAGGVWHPEFFDGQAWFVSGASEAVELSRIDFEKLLAGEQAVARVDWKTPPDRAAFAEGLRWAGEQFRSGELEKLVPVVFAHGVCATADREKWLVERLRFAVKATRGTALRLYGMWTSDATEFDGFLGATPEDLFRVDQARTTKLATMAVAGTRPIERGAELLTADKDLREHELVVDYLRETLTPLSSSPVAIGRTEVEPFGTLAHLVTEVRADLKPGLSIEEIVRQMHPTPALGFSPRRNGADLSPLRALDALTCPGEDRRGFGAPFVVSHGGRTEAVVAIRQVSFRSCGGEQLELRVGSGCGVVKGSELETEWRELLLKRRAVTELLGLQPEGYDAVIESLRVLKLLVAVGVREFVVCAGARNAPLVVALEHLRGVLQGSESIQVHSFFDERAASFFALGRSRRDGLKPVAIVTTSGTAATELHSALAEADHTGVPLVALTADRPRRLRGTGAPQSIDQTALYRQTVEWAQDIEAGRVLDVATLEAGLESWSLRRPVHINFALDEPLALNGDVREELSKSLPRFRRERDAFDLEYVAAQVIQNFVRKGALCVVGRLEAFEREAVLRFLKRAKMPVWLEGPSGLRGHPDLCDLEITGDDAAISTAIKSGAVKRVLRLGGVPTLRAWRDLDEPSVACETLSVSRLRFSGLGRGQHIQAELAGLHTMETFADSEAEHEPLRKLLVKKTAESSSLYFKLSKLIPRQAKVYVGNSLPIREWDRWAARDHVTMIEANRGVNGIDGQISTALGLAFSDDELWVIVGDLTALYDLNSLWAPKPKRLRIVVVNNGGGQIFSKLATLAESPNGANAFINSHSRNLRGFAELWGLAYRSVTAESVSDVGFENIQDQVVIEIFEDVKAVR